MYGEMMDFYGLTKDLNKAEYFDTDDFKKTLSGLEKAIHSGGIIALTGIVGIGKTLAIRQFQEALKSGNKIIVSKSLVTDRRRVTSNSLYTALFEDLPTGKDFKAPTQPEKRERALQALINKINKPVAFFIDEAHELHWKTLQALKHTIEIVEDCKGTLAIIVIGHPKLENDLKKPSMEEVGARAKLFSLKLLGASQKKKYIEWVLRKCSQAKVNPNDIIDKASIDMLAERLITPLQITYYLTQALEKGFRTGKKPLDMETVESVLLPELDALEPKLARNGYDMQDLCKHLSATKSEVRSYFKGQLIAEKTEMFNKEIHKLGIL